MHEADDAAVWGSGLGRREHWTRWLLVAAVGVGMVGASGAAPGGRAAPVRLLMGAGVGVLVGYFLALEAVPGQELLQVRARRCMAPPRRGVKRKKRALAGCVFAEQMRCAVC
jgi:hypothetical protein